MERAARALSRIAEGVQRACPFGDGTAAGVTGVLLRPGGVRVDAPRGEVGSQVVVGRLAGDRDVVRVRLTQTARGDAHEPWL